jgi:putative addiction module component (TIGR02574 family)
MATFNLDDILKLPPSERIEIAQAIWDSVSDEDLDDAFVLSPELKLELDRRWAEHLADPESAIPWEVVERKLRGGR